MRLRPTEVLISFLAILGTLSARGFFTEQGFFYVNIRWNQAMKWWTLYDRSGNNLGSARWNAAMNEYTFEGIPGIRTASARFNPSMKTWSVGGASARWEPGMSRFYFSNGGTAVWLAGGWRIRDASNREVGEVSLYANQGGPDLVYHIPFLYLVLPKPPSPADRSD